MNALPPGTRRAALIAACAVGVFIGGGPWHPALAAPVDAMPPGTTTSPASGALALRIGVLSERLFDTAAAARWSSAQAALQTLHEQARQLDGAFEEHFDAVGGDIQGFHAARDSLDADLAEGDIAAGARDARALGIVANRITLVAGELAQPFADAHDAPVALKVDAAMFQARRMLDALVRGDTPGYESAHRNFRRLWLDLSQSPGLDGARLDALDRALTLAALSRSTQTVRELQRAAQDVVGSPAPDR